MVQNLTSQTTSKSPARNQNAVESEKQRIDLRLPVKQIKVNSRNARTHSRKQIREIADSIKAFGFGAPVLIDETYTLIAGHGRLMAAKELGLEEIPAVQLCGLSAAQKRALALADNKIAIKAGWDRSVLATELPELADLLVEEGLDVAVTGFEPAEIDQITADFEQANDPDDDINPGWLNKPIVSVMGDIWELGPHRLVCGDAREGAHLDRLLQGERPSVAFMDPPYNRRVSQIGGRGRIKHAEFAMASGEMSRDGFVAFLADALGPAAHASRDGAVHFVCMDWRHVGELLDAGRQVYGETLNIIAWVKANGGQGSFYRSRHELIVVFRVGVTAHLNNIELGRHGRSRSNVWEYAGINSFRAGRLDELRAHPTAKPVALVADALKDCSRRGDVVLDTFGGSGTTLMAAERVGRRARILEIEPRYVDTTIRRWQSFTGKDAVNAATGRTFEEIAAEAIPAEPAVRPAAGRRAHRRGHRHG